MEPKRRLAYIKHPTYTKLGNCFCVFLNNSLFIVVGPHWVFNLCIIPLISMILLGYIVYVVPQMQLYPSIGGALIMFTCLFSYSITALKDPGIVLRDHLSDSTESAPSNSTICSRCLIVQDKTIEHCEDCNLCMKNLDHHCIFTGKCIAQNNLICFYLFLSSIFGFFIFSLFFVFSLDIKTK